HLGWELFPAGAGRGPRRPLADHREPPPAPPRAVRVQPRAVLPLLGPRVRHGSGLFGSAARSAIRAAQGPQDSLKCWNLRRSEDRQILGAMYRHPHEMEPMLPATGRPGLERRAAELVRRSAALEGALHPVTRG